VKRTAIVLSATIALLMASNAWLAFGVVDCGISRTYRDVSVRDSAIALRQLLAIVPVTAASPQDKGAVLAAATKAADHPDSFEKEGYVWTGRIGLKFGPDNRVVEVVTNP
jgi:hypothetical protein